MTPQEMQARSAEKVKQVVDLMKTLHLKTEAREKMDQGGFIEKMVFWIDEEKYEPVAVVKDTPGAFGAGPAMAKICACTPSEAMAGRHQIGCILRTEEATGETGAA